ncbi:MAG: hypothetical protein ABSF83_01880 [Nitrososphaerales archaeon]|jgi:hypothetical protein
MPSRIEISDETRAGLNRRAASMKRRLGRRVTFDEVIRELLEDAASKVEDEETPLNGRKSER